jgi:hypothetical protein
MTQTPRRLVHTRSIRVDAYRREDGLWDLVAGIQDVKHKDVELASGTRRAGDPFHDMLLTVTIDGRMRIIAVQAHTQAAPFPGTCETFPEVYQKLVGLNLLDNFRAAVRERVGGNQGCTHITELATILPTAAIQAFAGEVTRLDADDEPTMPRHLDRCRAMRLDGPIVARHFPRWHRIEGDKR